MPGSKVDGCIRDFEMDIEIRRIGHQAMQPGRQPFACKRDAAVYDEAGDIALAAQCLGFPLQFRQKTRHGAKIRVTRIRQFNPSRQATEKRHAQMVFERLYLSANRSVGEMKLLGRNGHA